MRRGEVTEDGALASEVCDYWLLCNFGGGFSGNGASDQEDARKEGNGGNHCDENEVSDE